jgi:hypothetical protein
MGSFSWDYYRLPEDKIPVVQKALDEYDLETLFDLYYDHKLGTTKYCCPTPIMFSFFNDLIDKRR